MALSVRMARASRSKLRVDTGSSRNHTSSEKNIVLQGAPPNPELVLILQLWQLFHVSFLIDERVIGETQRANFLCPSECFWSSCTSSGKMESLMLPVGNPNYLQVKNLSLRLSFLVCFLRFFSLELLHFLILDNTPLSFSADCCEMR